MQEDRQLVMRLQVGDRDALCRIYQKYKDKLLTVALTLLTDDSLAEDCLHDVFVKLAGEAGRLKIKHNLKGYLTTCVANRARDHWRRKARLDVPISEIPELSGDWDGPEKRHELTETWRLVLAALNRLPYEQREVVVLHLQAEMTFREIAHEQGVTINTVQSRYRYGMDKLQKILATDRQNDPKT